MRKNPIFSKLCKASLAMLVAFPFMGIAQSPPIGRECLNSSGFDLMQAGKLQQYLQNVCTYTGTSDTNVKASCNPSKTQFTFVPSGDEVNVTANGFVTSGSTTKSGRVFYTIFYEKTTTISEHYDSYNYMYCDFLQTADSGTRISSFSVSASITGYFDFYKPLPNTPVEIIGSKCFTDTISLKTSSDFQNFVCEWAVEQGGLAPTSPTTEWAVSYEHEGTGNQFDVNFTVEDTSVCNSGEKSGTIVIGTSTETPTLTVDATCVPMGQNIITATMGNYDAANSYTYLWAFHTNNGAILPSGTVAMPDATFDIGNHSGRVVLKSVGICDTASAEVMVNRIVTPSAVQLWVSDTACVFPNNVLQFSLNPTLEEKIVWSFPADWTKINENETSGTIELQVGGESGVVSAKSEACPTDSVQKSITVESNTITVKIDGDTCLNPGESFSFTATVGGASDFEYHWSAFGLSSTNATFSDIVPNNLSGSQEVRLIVEKCGKEFRDSIMVNFYPAQPAAINVDNGKSCINVGMGDTLYVSIPSDALGATTHTWTAEYSNGTQVIPTQSAGGLQATIIVGNRSYGDSLKIKVVGVNACGDGQARELTIPIEGAGNHQLASRLFMGFMYQLVITPADGELLPDISTPGFTHLSKVGWNVNGTPAASHNDSLLYYFPDPSDTLFGLGCA